MDVASEILRRGKGGRVGVGGVAAGEELREGLGGGPLSFHDANCIVRTD